MLLRRLVPWIVLAAAVAGCAGPAEAPRAADGRLALSAAAVAEGVALRGTWRAQAGAASTDVAAFDHDDAAWARVTLPEFFRGQGFPDQGLVTYRLHLRLPPDAPPLHGYVLQANNAHALYAARPGHAPVRLAASGRPGATAEATVRSRRPALFTLPADTALVLTWQVASHDYRLGGPHSTLHLAPADALYRSLLGEMGLVFATFGLYLFLALSFGFYWRHRRDDQQLLAVALIAAVMALRTVVVAGVPDFLLGEAYPFRLRIALEVGTYLALNGLSGWLVVAFFPREFAPLRLGRLRLRPPADPNAFASRPAPRPASRPAPRTPAARRRFNTAAFFALTTASAALTVLALAAPPSVTAVVLESAFGLTLVFLVLGSAVVGGAVRRRRPLAVGMALGLGVLFAGCVHDLLLANGWLPGRPYLTTYTFLVFLLVQSSAVAHRHAHYARLARERAGALGDEVRARTLELRATAVAAHAASLAKSQFVAAVSHELRTPLGTILGYAGLLRDNLGSRLGPDEREFIGAIEASGRRLLGLVNDLLDIAKLEAGRLEMRLGPVHLQTLVGEVVSALYPLALSKGLALRADAVPPDAYAHADAERLRQVLINLVSNAVKFTDAGTVTLRVHPAPLGDARGVAVAVEDTGPGISRDFLPRLFDRFAQDPVAYNRTQRGTGLGLTVSREFVVRMDGTIDVATELGAGSTFTVVLPVADAPEPAAASRRAAGAAAVGAP